MVSMTKYMGVPGQVNPQMAMTTAAPASGMMQTMGQPAPFVPAQINTAPPVNTAQPMPVAPLGAGVPPTGLIGAEQAIGMGQAQSAGILGGAMNQITAPNAYTQGGLGAAGMQAALSGANGPQAAAAAQAQFQQSPAAQYQMQQMQQATERSAAARGGLLGGNVLRELQQNAAGIASQDYQNQFANLGSVADRGASMQAQSDSIKAGLSRDLADTAFSAGLQRGGLRTNAGQAIAQNAQQAASSISNLLNQRGVVVSDIMAKDISTITDMIYQSGLQDSMGSQQLAAILANISGGQASNVMQGNAAIGASNAAGTIGVGNAVQQGIQQGIATYPGVQPAQTRPQPVTTTNTGANYGGYA